MEKINIYTYEISSITLGLLESEYRIKGGSTAG
jgi:hypothetical protein